MTQNHVTKWFPAVQEDQAVLLELSYLSKLSHPRLVRYLNSGLLSETLPGPSGESEALHYIAYVRIRTTSNLILCLDRILFRTEGDEM